jgi:hypothetical protein
MITFTAAEKTVLDGCLKILEEIESPFAFIVGQRIKDSEQLAAIVDRAPSPMSDLLQMGPLRTSESLAKKLCDHGLGHVVDLPTKAVLGHGLTISKLHLFGLLMKLLNAIGELGIYREGIEREYNDLLFTLMAEDLYTSLISNQEMKSTWVKEAALELIKMWDLRTSGYLETFALATRDLWQARHTIVPVLGTLMGTVEIMRISALLPTVWANFLSDMATNEEVIYALEEFLFDLNYEELVTLRAKMVADNLKVVNRRTAHIMLNKQDLEPVEQTVALALYKSYMRRQHTAKIRGYRKKAGPKRSLEEYFVIFLLLNEKSNLKM